MSTQNTAAVQATTLTIVQTSNYIVTPVLSDNIKDAWNKLISDLRGSGVVGEAVHDLREGVNEVAAALKADLQATGTMIENGVRSEFAAFKTTSSEGMNDITKAAYLKLLNSADIDITAIAKTAVADVWRETDDLSKSLNTILDNALTNTKLDIQTLSTQVIGALQKEFGDLVNDMQGNITGNYQKAVADLALAAGAVGIMVSKDQLTTFQNKLVSVVAADIVVGAAKTGIDITSELVEMTADLTSTVNRNKDSLLKILAIDGINLIQAAAKAAWKTIKKWFKW